jgi:hypothetical protein
MPYFGRQDAREANLAPMEFDHQERIYVEAAIGYNPDTPNGEVA